MKKISLLFIVAISIILTSCKSGSDTDIKVITVNNAEELIQALGNDRIIILNNNEGIFWLTEAIEAAVEANFIDKYSNIVYLDENNRYTIPKDYSGILAHDDELCFYNMKNLTIRGANEEKYTKIYISLDYKMFSLVAQYLPENLELGHYPERGPMYRWRTGIIRM